MTIISELFNDAKFIVKVPQKIDETANGIK